MPSPIDAATTSTPPRDAPAARRPRASASERAEAVRARARAIEAEHDARARAAVRAKDDKIATIAERRERDGAYASSTGTVVDGDARSPVKRAKTAAKGAGSARAAWVDANDARASASSEGSANAATTRRSEDDDEDEAVRRCARGIVERVIEDAEREREVGACVARAVAGAVRANANARFETTPKKSKAGEGLRRALSIFQTPKVAASSAKSRATSASASASTPTSTPKPKSAMEAKLSDALSAARAKAKEIEDELADSPLRSPFKQRMRAGVREHPIRRLRGAAVRLYKRAKHDVIKRVERATEKNPTAVGGGVLGFAVLVLASRRGRGP